MKMDAVTKNESTSEQQMSSLNGKQCLKNSSFTDFKPKSNSLWHKLGI